MAFTGTDSLIDGADRDKGRALQFDDDDQLRGVAVIGHAAVEAAS